MTSRNEELFNWPKRSSPLYLRYNWRPKPPKHSSEVTSEDKTDHHSGSIETKLNRWENTVSPFQGDIIIITSRRKKLFFLEWGFLKRADQLQLQLQRHTYINKKCRANFFFKRRLAAAKRVKHSKAKIYSSPEWPLVEKNYFFWNLFSVLCCHRLPLFLRKLVIWHLRTFSCFLEDCKRWSVETGR